MTKQIELTQGKVAIVDDADYEWVNQWKWHAQRRGSIFYAGRNAGIPPFRKVILLHREIMQAPPGMDVDHADGNGLNCTRANMRLATRAENLSNRGAQANNTSGYKGVMWDKQTKKWRAQITVNGEQTTIGRYTDKKEAARAYDKAARKHHGRFARTNF